MSIRDPVPLNRTFSPLYKTDNDASADEIMALVGAIKPIDWVAVEKRYRSVILAGAGAGKTHEMTVRALSSLKAGRVAFLIRIEDIVGNFENSFDVGSAEAFDTWHASATEAWFYLDSIDEARLKDPRAFEAAIRLFAGRIKVASHRAHIIVSSRPYAWRSQSDSLILKKYLPSVQSKNVATPSENQEKSDSENITENQDPRINDEIGVFILNDLNEADIRTFAHARHAVDVDQMLEQIYRQNLMSVAVRPFDLERLIETWKREGQLPSRFDFLRLGIGQRLSEVNPDRELLRPLAQAKGRAGAQRLAAAVVLSGKPGIRVPDEYPIVDGVDATAVLADWHPHDIRALLERGVFDDAIYGKVRFRHREVRELLAAEWFTELLQKGTSRRAVEALIFREKYGHSFIAPRLRPILPWLILLDEEVRKIAFTLCPEIVVEGGDPSRLPLVERQRLLGEIVTRVSGGTGSRSANDNDAITRIAEPDLAPDVLRLICQYREDDNALFFLGRMVSQGKMTDCVLLMKEIAVNPGRGLYARIAALRAVAMAGSRSDFDMVWDRIITDGQLLDRRLAAEVVRNAKADRASVDRLVSTIDRLSPYERFRVSGLSEAFQRYIEGFDLDDPAGQLEVARLVRALNEILGREPHLIGGRERISREQSWLLAAAAFAVERLISVRSAHSLESDTVSILHKAAAADSWHDVDLGERAQRLRDMVPAWPELNDVVFWSAIAAERANRQTTEGAPVFQHYSILHNEFCSFTAESLDRVVGFIGRREHEDDQRVAVSLAHSIIKDLGFPDVASRKLSMAVEGKPALVEQLASLMDRRPTEEQRTIDERFANARRRRQESQAAEAERKRCWVAQLKADPTLVRRPATVEPGEMTNHQFGLMQATDRADNSRWQGGDWRSLVGTFGDEVAAEYRHAAMDHWRRYSPALASEGVDTTSVPLALIFGLAGLEIEAEQVPDFPRNLSDDELKLAMRYVPWELNGLPTWIERAFNDRPQIVSAAILSELAWDLGRHEAPRSYMLHDIVYHAPWLHEHIADWVIEWLEASAARGTEMLRYAIHIARSSNSRGRLLALAAARATETSPAAIRAKWFALWVDADVEAAISRLEDWLGSMPPEEATIAAEHFITELLGDRHGAHLGTSFDSYRKPMHLKRLYILMHQHIRMIEDTKRAGTGVYTRGMRDDAQEARNRLLELLCEIPGKETFVALKQLENDHPDAHAHRWVSRLAVERAEKDGDLEEWSDQQLREFDGEQLMTPCSNAQLFHVAVQKLLDIRVWLEDGNDSPYLTWQRAGSEAEMRNLIAGRLNDLAHGRYTCAQENEMPNAQRPDIWVQRPGITPVPIELKVLDKGWTGPSLCERLRNQLAGDYLRAEAGGRGVMLLVWQGQGSARTWQISGRSVELGGLEAAMQTYWHSISGSWPDIDEVKVIVVDLTRRGLRSKT